MATSIVRNQGDGDRRWFAGGGAHTWKAYAAETGNSLLVFEDELEQGKVTPMHFHADVDEALYVLEGEILLDDDGTEHKVGAGGFVFAPRGRARVHGCLRHCTLALYPNARFGPGLLPAHKRTRPTARRPRRSTSTASPK